MQPRWPEGKASRGIFCSRTLSLRSITTIGYDMDYTLVHYNVKVCMLDPWFPFLVLGGSKGQLFFIQFCFH